MSDEYGGFGYYGLFLEDGLLFASYSHEDTLGGVPFSVLESETYVLNKNEQKKLLENILSTLTLK
jgi:hypothetical protein